jgi:DNA-binding beta-propeller fold protein YncE
MAVHADQELLYPSSIAVDQQGSIYVVDKEACAVFKIPAKGGELTVVARGERKPATPLYHLAGIAVSSAGEIAVSSPATSNIYWLRDGSAVAVGEADATKTALARPQGLAFDPAKSLIAADTGLEAVVRITEGRVTKIASVPAPTAVSIDKSGNIAVVSAGRRRLVSIDKQGKVAEIAAGAPLEFPLAVAIQANGTYLVADSYAKALFKIPPGGKPVVLVKGDPFQNPVGVATESDGNILVADSQAKSIFRVSPDGKVSTVYCAKK